MQPLNSILRHVRLHVFSAWCLAGCFPGTALPVSAQPEVDGKPGSSAFIRIPKDTDDWTRHFRIGAMVGMNISASFNDSGAFGVNSPAGVYDNGYVHPSGNAFGTTTDWGYQSAAQYDPVAHTLTMTGTTGFTPNGNTGLEAGGSPSPGFEMAYGGNLWYWKHARVGWDLGFGLLPVSITGRQMSSGQINQNVYSFDAGTIESMPPPGYSGASSGSGPAIYSTPVLTGHTSSSGNISSSHTLDATLYTVRFGPSFYWDLTERVGMSLGGGPAVGIVSGDCKYSEIITTSAGSTRNTGRIQGTKLTYGGYVDAAVMYHVQQDADIYISAQYMPMSDASISGGGREGRLKLGGQICISAGINWPF